jgi:hypothetical protein
MDQVDWGQFQLDQPVGKKQKLAAVDIETGWTG